MLQEYAPGHFDWLEPVGEPEAVRQPSGDDTNISHFIAVVVTTTTTPVGQIIFVNVPTTVERIVEKNTSSAGYRNCSNSN